VIQQIDEKTVIQIQPPQVIIPSFKTEKN